MPQCQRSPNATRLDRLTQAPSGTWTCPGPPYGAVGCEGGETYELVADDVHRSAVEAIVSATERELGTVSPWGDPLVFWAELPQHIVWEGTSEIYVSRSANGSDIFHWQLAHEAFHHVATPPGVLHWTHEMLASLWSFKYLLGTGRATCALASMQGSVASMGECPLEAMLSFTGLPYPPGLYGRASYTGFLLEGAVGWERLKELGRSFDGSGRPDVEAWRNELPPPSARAVASILAG